MRPVEGEDGDGDGVEEGLLRGVEMRGGVECPGFGGGFGHHGEIYVVGL